MRILLDTHVLLWFLVEPKRIGSDAFAAINDNENDVMFSAASIWEIAIKSALKREDFALPAADVLAGARANGFREVPVTSEIAKNVEHLPLHHRDPFDRLLIAQAMAEPAVFFTADSQLEAYSELVRRV
ncbi:MAG: type II toxin-antitoxin system VapC family toxin [Alphaproteobacteria bacterium]|nr:type II toxin-antitoxin system VapC family toxin [Alphaproteobacteria bacterium]MBV9419344.1 type II toxin-antitoxin system VapC family toxin [Alphaproteobacteria bacterium]MBV9542281.1 type II toxin-antitoxin system VapC family toxin [Alphaproteobacteria bacterium]MBV9905585.1 type II toxin-antitoxin system VapC family toxin [Alphaproteobacteria bacterium]